MCADDYAALGCAGVWDERTSNHGDDFGGHCITQEEADIALQDDSVEALSIQLSSDGELGGFVAGRGSKDPHPTITCLRPAENHRYMLAQAFGPMCQEDMDSPILAELAQVGSQRQACPRCTKPPMRPCTRARLVTCRLPPMARCAVSLTPLPAVDCSCRALNGQIHEQRRHTVCDKVGVLQLRKTAQATEGHPLNPIAREDAPNNKMRWYKDKYRKPSAPLPPHPDNHAASKRARMPNLDSRDEL